ncbi:MAG: alpha/beta hydrolase [Flavobacteriaceae bacterium]|nr:alpha/beta hydrolase [Flavobacteriaceae bacterium]
MKKLIIPFILFFFIPGLNAQKTVHFTASDGIKITADLYMTSNTNAPFIILYHQAGYSRGEYRSIAPKLNELGFNCMAIDQRSGKEVNGIINETHLEALKLNKPTEYVDAIPDVEAAYQYVKLGIKPNKIIIWGSSYSAALVFFLGSAHYNGVDGILAFSPGEYFKINGKEIKSYASKVECPIFITSAKNEEEQWKGIYNAVKKEKSSFLPQTKGKHGSKALWKDNNSHEAYWNAVKGFLLKIKA